MRYFLDVSNHIRHFDGFASLLTFGGGAFVVGLLFVFIRGQHDISALYVCNIDMGQAKANQNQR